MNSDEGSKIWSIHYLINWKQREGEFFASRWCYDNRLLSSENGPENEETEPFGLNETTCSWANVLSVKNDKIIVARRIMIF